MFKNLFQFIKVKLVFHIMLEVITKTNCQRSDQPFSTQISFYFWDKLLYDFLKTNNADVGDNWNSPQTQIETRSWTCFGQTKIKNSNSIICTIVSNRFPSMVNNINPSLVAMEPWRKLDLWTFDFEWQIVQWISPLDQMMTSITWQFP